MDDFVKYIEQAQRQLDAFINKEALVRLQLIYNKAELELQAGLAETMQRFGKKSFTFQARVNAFGQTKKVIAQLNALYLNEFIENGVLVSRKAVRDILNELEIGNSIYMNMPGAFSNYEVAQFSGLLGDINTSLVSRYQTSVQKYGLGVISEIEQTLAVSQIMGKTPLEVTKSIAGKGGVFEGQFWKAERLARTEIANAYNFTEIQTLIDLQNEHGEKGLKKRITAMFDERTGDDSKFVDGQIRDLDEPFFDGIREYQYPPNRPNDRETISGWMDGW